LVQSNFLPQLPQNGAPIVFAPHSGQIIGRDVTSGDGPATGAELVDPDAK
jgi:hypothetical protein